MPSLGVISTPTGRVAQLDRVSASEAGTQSAAAARFWSKVDRSHLSPGGCWIWLASRDQDGYGAFYPEPRRLVRAHRFARVLEGDDVRGRVVRHLCDNPPCCNPDHLITGTVQENVADRQAKGRGQRGETNHKAALTAEQVARIKAVGAGMGRGRTTRLAAEYGVSPRAISHILTGTNWRHVGAAS